MWPELALNLAPLARLPLGVARFRSFGAMVTLIYLGVIEGAALPMPRHRTLKVVAGIAASFAGLAGTIIFLLVMKIITFGVAKLMLVALLGMYVGFGILIAIYRLIRNLE